MNYQLALPPDLGMTSAEFAAAWNADPACRAAAEAQTTDEPPRRFETITVGVIVFNVALGLATNALYDLIKNLVQQKLQQKGLHADLELLKLEQPDGSELLVVKPHQE